MTLDGFLTFLTLAVAIYALLPPVAKLRLKLGFAIQIFIATLGLLLVLYIHFFDAIHQLCTVVLGSVCNRLPFPASDTVTPPRAAFLVVLIWILLALTIHRFARRGAGSLPTLSRLVDRLLYEQRFAEVIELVETTPNIDRPSC